MNFKNGFEWETALLNISFESKVLTIVIRELLKTVSPMYFSKYILKLCKYYISITFSALKQDVL